MRTLATQLFGRNATGSIVVILQVALIQAERAIRSKNNDNNRGAWAWDVLCPQAGSLASPSALS